MTAGMASIQVEVNGRALFFSVQPRYVNGRTMVPLRGIFESLGAQVDWDESTQTINASEGSDDVHLSIGDRRATVNRRAVYLDAPAMVFNGSTLVPLRFVSEALGADVQWYDASETASITSQGGRTIHYTSGTRDGGVSGRVIRNLVAPIALYPDPLLAIILPASTYPDQVQDAANMNLGNDDHAIDRQDWDISVKALAHYPNLLRKMAQDPDWTAALGQVYVQQPRDVMDAIQSMRRQARANGVLQSSREQRIYLEGTYVRIVPAQGDMIYVPQYDPNLVYVSHRPAHSANLLVFGLGLSIGVWLSNDTDWSQHRVYNHGWSASSGWVATARPHITINNTYIINKNRPAMVNHNIITRTVDLRKVRNYTLPVVITPRPQPPSRPSGPNMMNQQPRPHADVTRPTNHWGGGQKDHSVAPSRPTYTAPADAHRPPTGTNKPGRNTKPDNTALWLPTNRNRPDNKSGTGVPDHTKAPSRPTYTRPADNHIPSVSTNRPGRNAAPDNATPRQPTNQTRPNNKSGDKMPGNKNGGQNTRSTGKDHNKDSNNKDNGKDAATQDNSKKHKDNGNKHGDGQ